MLPALAALADPKIIKPILITAGLGVGGYFIYKAYQSAQQEKAEKALDNSPEAQQANHLLALLHPYSYKKLVLNPFDALDVVRDKIANVDEEAVIKFARGIKSYDKVRTYYAQFTGNRLNLTDDIRVILNANEAKRFFNNIELAKQEGEEAVKKSFDVTANPTGAMTVTNVYEDSLLKKPLFSYKKGVKLGTALKKVSVPFRNSDGTLSKLYLYYIKGTVGQIKDKTVYVMVSQVKSV
jgi:hypothetical protein